MSERKVIVCLANSRKHYGRCVAGIEIVEDRAKDWIRPVSSRPGAEVSEHERQYKDGSDPQVLDVIEVPLIKAAPASFQAENWILDPEAYWVRIGRMTWDQLAEFESSASPLWPSKGPSTYHGRDDRVSAAEADRFSDSLRLIQVESVVLRVFAPGAEFGNPKRRVQARFTYIGTQYHVWVTDPVLERDYLAKSDGLYSLGECFLTMSLGELSDDGYCYKLAAAVITRDRAKGG